MKTTFIAWTEGDHTVGDGTLNAKVEIDHAESDVDWVKDSLRTMLSGVWDTRPFLIVVMTQAEFDAFTKEEEEVG